jgi:hypothetical protein
MSEDSDEESDEQDLPEEQGDGHIWGEVSEPRVRRITMQNDMNYCCCDKFCQGRITTREFSSSVERKSGTCCHIHFVCWAKVSEIFCIFCNPEKQPT